jgi:hypothetical protein
VEEVDSRTSNEFFFGVGSLNRSVQFGEFGGYILIGFGERGKFPEKACNLNIGNRILNLRLLDFESQNENSRQGQVMKSLQRKSFQKRLKSIK